MGALNLILKPGFVDFKIEDLFPDTMQVVGLSGSGGAESTLLMYLLAERYGPENVHVFSGVVHGRRHWESGNAARMAEHIGIKNVHLVDDDFLYMSAREQKRLITRARNHPYNCQGYFIGESLNYFSPNSTPQPIQEEINRTKHSIYLPFIKARLTKSHIIDIYFQLGIQDILFKTHSCTVQDGTHCGECYCCLERVKGFNDLGLQDKATYDRDWETITQRTLDKTLIKKNWEGSYE